MNIKTLRNEIDTIDRLLLKLLANRFRLVSLIGQKKREQGTPIVDTKREKEVLEVISREAKKLGLSVSWVRKMLREIIKESKRRERTL